MKLSKRIALIFASLLMVLCVSVSVSAKESPTKQSFKGTEKLPFFLKWKFFFYIFSIFFRKSTKKLWLTP